MKGRVFFVIFAFSALVIYFALDKLIIELPEVKLTEHNQLIMYSITGCSSCEEKRGELSRAQIPYVEHVVDIQPGAAEDFMTKIISAGFTPGKIGYPSFDVKGTFIPNNPPLIQIRKHLKNDEAY